MLSSFKPYNYIIFRGVFQVKDGYDYCFRKARMALMISMGFGGQPGICRTIAVGHEKAFELSRFELAPERSHPFRHRARRADLFEALKHGPAL
jgi:hypothetical protein